MKYKTEEERKAAKAAAARKYARLHPDRVREASRKSQSKHSREYHRLAKRKFIANNPEHHAKYQMEWKLNSKYGITIEDYNRMFEEQNGCCAVCKKHQSELVKKLSVDHDHLTGRIRGLLCDNCNRGLGLLKDSIPVIEKLLSYLRKSDLGYIEQ